MAQGKGQGQDQGQGQGQGKGDQGQAQAQGEGKGQGQGQGEGQGQGQGQQPGTPAGQETAAGQDSQGKGSGNGANGQPGPNGTGGDNPNGQGSGGISGMPGGSGEAGSPLQTDQPVNAEAYHEALQDLKNQAQQTAELTHNVDANQLLDAIARHEHDQANYYRPATPFNVTKLFADVQQPLDKTILDLEALEQHAQRDEIVKTPDLDDTPPSYRSAVSDYFEEVSRDYHPATPPPPPDPGTKSNP